jgi:arginine decarboxylase
VGHDVDMTTPGEGPSHDPTSSGAPLLEAWRRARDSGMRPMQIPGHKMRYVHDAPGWAVDLVGDTVRDDIALQGEVDDNAFSNDWLGQAERLWTAQVGADHCRFLVGGSSQGNIAAIGTVADQGIPIAVDRTAHRSSQAALVISGAVPVWIYPRLHPEFHLPIGMPVSAITDVTEPVTGFFVTSPSYIGTLSDVAGLAAAAHDKGQPLVVDQAWGAHLDFMPGRGAISQGADMVVTSVHKALTGYSQTAVVAVREGRGFVHRSVVNRWVDLTGTTSPSGTLLASIDATRAAMARDGQQRLDLLSEAVDEARKRLARVPGLIVLDDDNAGCAVDPLKLTLILPGTGVDGTALGQALHGLGHGPETADRDSLVCTATVSDEPEWIVQFADLLADLIDRMRGEPRAMTPLAVWQVTPDVVVTPREAFFADRRRIPLRDAQGEVSAEQFCPYPPGVPLLAPGERVTSEAIDAILAAARIGRVAYNSDPTLETIEVIDVI